MTAPATLPIYLDYNASAPLDPRVREAMAPYQTTFFGNSRSGHPFGVRLKEAIERARGQVATMLGCESDEIIFTSGGSEANNLAIKGLAWATEGRRGLVISTIEHYSVAYACDFLAKHHFSVERIGVDGKGRVDLDSLDARVSQETLLVCIQHANNEIGTVQDLPAIARLVHGRGALLHCDAAQSVGKLPVRVSDLGADMLTLAGHKFGGPAGIGALYRRRGVVLEPLIHGAGHEDGLRSGTHSAALIVGLGEACALVQSDLVADARRMTGLRDRLHARILESCPDAHLNGDPDHRLPHTLNISFPGLDGTDLLAAAPEVAATTGAACHSGRREASMALQAIGAPLAIGLGAIRLSLGRGTTTAEVDAAGAAIGRAATALRRSGATI